MSHIGLDSGIQSHSAGPTFPWYRVHRGDGRAQWYNGSTGELAGPWVPLDKLGDCPPQTAGEWVIRFQLAGVSKGYKACAYNVRTHETRGGWHTSPLYDVALIEARAHIPPLEIAETPAELRQSPALGEFTFLIPVVRDSDKGNHSYDVERWFLNSLIDLAGGYTVGPQVAGVWRNDQGELVYDASTPYIVAVPPDKVAAISELAAEACKRFDQQCVYVSHTGIAKLVFPSSP